MLSIIVEEGKRGSGPKTFDQSSFSKDRFDWRLSSFKANAVCPAPSKPFLPIPYESVPVVFNFQSGNRHFRIANQDRHSQDSNQLGTQIIPELTVIARTRKDSSTVKSVASALHSFSTMMYFRVLWVPGVCSKSRYIKKNNICFRPTDRQTDIQTSRYKFASENAS